MYGSFVRAVRTSRGLSQSEHASISGVSQPNLSAIEHDRRVPSADTLNRLVVSCGYELAAVAGDAAVFCPLPRGGWFPDEDDPGPLEGDPPDEPPALSPGAPTEERLRVIEAVMEAAGEALR
jgi:transcriptional regulator with XRE-family HTH domain